MKDSKRPHPYPPLIFPEGKKFAEDRLAAASIELRDIIYTAWIRSGDPVKNPRQYRERITP